MKVLILIYLLKLLVINLHKSNMYFNLDNLITTNKTISNKNIYLKFNNISKITKININNMNYLQILLLIVLILILI